MRSGRGDWITLVCFFMYFFFLCCYCSLCVCVCVCERLKTSVLDLIVRLEIHCNFNAVTLFSPYCIEEINIWSAAICMHARTDTCTNTPSLFLSHTHTHRHTPVRFGSTKPNKENTTCATAMRWLLIPSSPFDRFSFPRPADRWWQ